MKKFFTFVLVACASLAAVAQSSGTCGESATWELSEDNILTISGTGDASKGDWGTSAVSIIVEEGITSLANESFSNFASLTEVSLPNTLTTIGNKVFFGCSNLAEITLPESLTHMGHLCFNGTKIFENSEGPVVYVGDFVTYCKESGMPKELEIKEGIRFICPYAFAYLECSWDTLTLPSTLERIDNYAFYYQYLSLVTCRATTPPTCGTSVFYKQGNCSLLVPEGQASAYKNASPWNMFNSVKEYEASGISAIKGNESATPIAIYGIDGRKHDSLQKGINLLRLSNGKTVKQIIR